VITFQDFQKVEMKVGRVLAVEDHPNADKLMVIHADVGESTPRTLVAALRQHYRNEELVRKLIVVLTNLQPARLRGIESNGMLLAAQQGDAIAVLTLDRDLAPGARVL